MISKSFKSRLIGALIGALAALVVVQLPVRLRVAELGLFPSWPLLTLELVFTLAPVVGAIAGAFFAVRPLSAPSNAATVRSSGLPRSIAIAVAVLYLITWVFGVPATITEFSKSSAEWLNFATREKLTPGQPESESGFTYARPYFAFVPLPGVVFMKLNADTWGGWAFCAWVPGRVWIFGRRLDWMS